MARYSGQVPFIEVPFTEIQEQIKKDIPEGYIMTVTRRFMMMITDRIREERNGLAIMTGESLGQVASQTLESMLAINAVTTTPVLRPLVAMDKTEIVEIAKEIDDAIEAVLSKGIRTGDIAQANSTVVGCKEMGDAVIAELQA